MPKHLPRLALLLVAAVAVLLFAWSSSGRRTQPVARGPEPAERHPAAEQTGRESGPSRLAPTLPAPDASAEGEPPATAEGFVPAEDMDAMAAAWSVVNLDEVREAMPDNLYFELSAPTQDESVLAERAAERERWNAQYGKILSGTGGAEEVRDYFDFRARLSTDYVEFTTYILDHFGEQIPERDVGLLELARRLHLARLEEIPRKVEEALERKRMQDEARAAWLADEAAFGNGAPAEAEPK